MQKLHDLLETTGLLSHLRNRCSEQTPCYLVGGSIRDAILGQSFEADLDFSLPGNPTAFAQEIAASFSGSWFLLDADRQQSRVVFHSNGVRITCDFIPFRAKDLEEDLRKRDFTINAIAWPCHLPLEVDQFIDPMGGVRDIHKQLLRICNSKTFIDDPLRTLKGVRHAATLNFDFEPVTAALLRESVSHIDQIAPERLRAELAKTLSAENAWRGISLLQQTGLLNEIFGQPAKKEGLEQALAGMQRFHRLLHSLDDVQHSNLLTTLDVEGEEFLSLRSLLKFTVFLQGYRPIALQNVLRALRFSNHSIDFILACLQLDIPAKLEEIDALPNSSRAHARWVAGLGRAPLAVLLLLLSYLPADREVGPILDSLSTAFLSYAENDRLPDLLDGDWLRATYNLPSGPVVGRLLELLRQAELQGEIASAAEARLWLHDRQKTIDNILLEHL